MTLDEFLSSDLRNAWVGSAVIGVYVRKSIRAVYGQPMTCLDVANIEVPEPFQRQGIFKAFLALCESKDFDCVMVENVHNPVLIPYLLRIGYVEREGYRDCYLKVLG